MLLVAVEHVAIVHRSHSYGVLNAALKGAHVAETCLLCHHRDVVLWLLTQQTECRQHAEIIDISVGGAVYRLMTEQYPLHLSSSKIQSGYLSLTPVTEDTSCQIYIVVE